MAWAMAAGEVPFDCYQLLSAFALVLGEMGTKLMGGVAPVLGGSIGSPWPIKRVRPLGGGF